MWDTKTALVGRQDKPRQRLLGVCVVPTQTEVEDLILEFLAQETGSAPETLREELLAEGAEMPFSSLVLVQFVVELEKRYGVRVPDTTAAANALRSVSTFAELIVSLGAGGTTALRRLM
jgi:acyl carrier protein